jgi:hypothetical protein
VRDDPATDAVIHVVYAERLQFVDQARCGSYLLPAGFGEAVQVAAQRNQLPGKVIGSPCHRCALPRHSLHRV